MNKGHRKSLQQEFLKKWVMGIQEFTSFSNNKHLNVFDRKKIIKQSADIAMASAKKPSTNWSRAVIMNASRDHKLILARRSRQILKRRRSRLKKNKKVLEAKTMARRLVKKRTQVLKRLVPGGEAMDGLLLIEETLDYIFSLQAQVDVMRFLVNASNDHDRDHVHVHVHPIPDQSN
ncbi:transcription factor IBH1-like 1 [Impatiens glandulifera]|uniref:transcription factor IBH1-like 1 n=1 Tax=Impatiens glandulifera TaxID=253017 RepID=UPI001FB13FC9|nr:transcription factor IBH1-like 1 [Impatiens glandulifera]XP_047309106.1 transcription factor IBH1-like 1 [Impatiens glandulifera]